MNAVEIEEAISELALQPFDATEFPYLFLESFGNKATTIKRLKSGTSNKSDVGGVLQANHIHIAVCDEGETTKVLTSLKSSPATSKAKAKFILATDGINFEAEDLLSGETIACEYQDFPNHFGFFLPLAGISTVKQLRDSSFDIRATSRLNRLYIELLKDNPDWGDADQRHEMNHFMARLIFCFFAEDTDIFDGSDLFTDTIEKMSARDSSNTHEVISEIFRAMNTDFPERPDASLPRWVEQFPYVNGGLFSGSIEVPQFSKIARSYLLHIGNLDWTQINPDIFGSMIQAVADDDERGSLGMHYTSVPNILKVLNPLFLDDLRKKLEQADSPRKLLNLRNRIARIRVFDPACGSGNFLVIAYKQMREIENTINERRDEKGRKSDIPLTNFRGIELRDFSAEIARLALIIAEYQCDVLYRGQKEALQEFLPLSAENWITCGNALHLDWLSLCPPTGTVAKYLADDLFETELEQPQIDFENEGGETYICGNPPYLGSKEQNKKQKEELKSIFDDHIKNWKSLDYVAGWFAKAAEYGRNSPCVSAFVATNSICQGQQVPILWPMIFKSGQSITFAHTSFKWANLASHNAGVMVIIVAISNIEKSPKLIYSSQKEGPSLAKQVNNINPYLVSYKNTEINKSSKPISKLSEMTTGNMPYGKDLVLSRAEKEEIQNSTPKSTKYLWKYAGGAEYLYSKPRYCLWIDDSDYNDAYSIPKIHERIDAVREQRLNSSDESGRKLAIKPHQFRERYHCINHSIILAKTSSENRQYFPAGLTNKDVILSSEVFVLFDAPIFNLALLCSKLHLIWIATVCGKMKNDFRYSNTMGWNTFPVSTLTEKNKADLTSSAEDILLAREAHFPATIADLYNPETMPENLRQAHERNDEVLERIYIGRRFKNDTERLEKLFELYTKMTAKASA
jgi:restriction-modification enzyme MmeI-like protein